LRRKASAEAITSPTLRSVSPASRDVMFSRILGSANFACDAIRVLGCRELENQDQVRLIDLRDTGREPACIDHELHSLLRCLDGRVRHRFAQTEVVDDNVHQVDAIACRDYLLRGHA
jgi:hypothetical protein